MNLAHGNRQRVFKACAWKSTVSNIDLGARANECTMDENTCQGSVLYASVTITNPITLIVMPRTKQAKKYLIVSGKRAIFNRVQKLKLKSALKSVSSKTVNKVVARLDKAVKARLIHANKASRLKSRLMKRYQVSQKPRTARGTSKTKSGGTGGKTTKST